MKTKEFVVFMSLIIVFSVLTLNLDVDYCAAKLHRFRSYWELKEFLSLKAHKYTLDDHPIEFASSGDLGLTKTMESRSLNEYSKTNIQVDGVDEADIVKTDGEYIYLISKHYVIIIKAYPPEKLAIKSKIYVNGTPKELFINGERLVVFYQNGSYSETTTTFISVYDISERKNPIFCRKIGVDGYYLASRMIGNYVYVVAGKPAVVKENEVLLPRVYLGEKWRKIWATEIYYSNIAEYYYRFITIVALNVQEDFERPAYKTLLVGWETSIYVSLKNIYLAMIHYSESSYGNKVNIIRTFLNRIHIDGDNIFLAAEGEVPGKVLNQFSMDEYNGYFRIATTSGNPSNWRNNLYILNMDLDVVSSLENIAPKERIYSARFIGNTCYLVTFRKVDPFFVIDLSNPTNPEILGELKISGYSDYLHLYDENYVIGIGKETIPAKHGDFSWYQGVKISLYNVADATNPKEIAKYEIGDRGSDSPILRDHKAFLFDEERNLLVIPVSVAKINKSKYPEGVPPFTCGNLVWQGVYVFHISLTFKEKILLRGKITHIENGDVHNTLRHIKRVLYINGNLYTISDGKIEVHSLGDLTEIGELQFKEWGRQIDTR